MFLDQPAQRLDPRQWHVARQNQHALAVDPIALEHRHRLHDRVPGAELLFLHRVARAIADLLLHRFALMSDHHHRRPLAYLGGEIENVVDERPSRGVMEDLDRGRLHPRAESGREDDHFDVFGHPSFLRIRSSVRP